MYVFHIYTEVNIDGFGFAWINIDNRDESKILKCLAIDGIVVCFVILCIVRV